MTDAPQYNAVLSNLDKLQTALQDTDGAEDSLLTKFKARKWLAAGAKTRADGLLTKALNQIENDTASYEVFVGMLNNVSGMQSLVKKITDICPLKPAGDEAVGATPSSREPVISQTTSQSVSSTKQHPTRKLDIERDIRKVKTHLKSYNKEELKDLFQELGLKYSTVQNYYDGSSRDRYSESLIRYWIMERDDVLKTEDYSGGATWENLNKAIEKLK